MPRERNRERRPRRSIAGSRGLFAKPSLEDLVVLLQAWRFWILAGLIGALLGYVIFTASPPPFRARATVNVDFHMEQAWPENTDREQFYYLERETRKLVEIAMSDQVLGQVARNVGGVSVHELRGDALGLEQPGSGGWHFYADDQDPENAQRLAAEWATIFAAQVRSEVEAANTTGPEAFITADLVQAEGLVVQRRQSVGIYMLVGAGLLLVLSAIAILALGIPAGDRS
jgi:capsular polysaccharide biosynthesis protein